VLGLRRWGLIRHVVLPAHCPAHGRAALRARYGVAGVVWASSQRLAGHRLPDEQRQQFFQTDVIVVCLVTYAYGPAVRPARAAGPKYGGLARELRRGLSRGDYYGTTETLQAPAVRIRGLTKAFDQRAVIDGLDLDIRPGEFVALLGPAACGKSTLLRIWPGWTPRSTGCPACPVSALWRSRRRG